MNFPKSLMSWHSAPGSTWKTAIVALLVSIITVLHFTTSTEHIYAHEIYQRSYYIPIVLAGFWFEVTGALVTAVSLSAVYLIHIIRDWGHHPTYSFQQYVEIGMYLAVAVFTGILSREQRRAREKLEKAGAELSAAYRKLNETFDQLRHADRLASLGQLAAVVSHEIRNPLASIQGAVEILGQDLAPSDPKTEFAEIAKKEVSSLERLTSEILQFSRPAPAKRQPVHLQEIVEAALRICSDQARHQNVELVLEASAPSCPVQVDPEQIKQVLLNIIINAIQAQPSGGKVVTRVREDSGTVAVSIQDSGPGISKEDLSRIFEPFFTTKEEGTGLGLAISQQLVAQNDGQIQATSIIGQGASFLITFPAVLQA